MKRKKKKDGTKVQTNINVPNITITINTDGSVVQEDSEKKEKLLIKQDGTIQKL